MRVSRVQAQDLNLKIESGRLPQFQDYARDSANQLGNGRGHAPLVDAMRPRTKVSVTAPGFCLSMYLILFIEEPNFV